MSRRRPNRTEELEEPGLFDLPLDPPGASRSTESPPPAADAPDEPGVLSLFDDLEEGGEPEPEPEIRDRREPGPRPVPHLEDPGDLDGFEAPAADPSAPRVTLASRFLAGLADLAIHAGVAVILLVGARLLGVAAGYDDWPALTVFLLAFSFLYSVLPLAFWGRTPGMAWAGLVARAPGGVSLTFAQTARRWLGGLVTLALLGLPTLLAALGGRSLADLVSNSELSAT
jgi:uncharacterized RDD family membrane protein YckC